MTKKICRRRVTADNGATVELTAVRKNGRVVEDARNGVTIYTDNGSVTVPLSAAAMHRTAEWFA